MPEVQIPSARKASRLITRLAAGAAVIALAGAAHAQQAASDAQKPDGGGEVSTTVKEVVVTGTHIRGTPPVGSSLLAVDRKDIELTGATTTDQVLELQPQVFNFGISDTQRNGTGGAGNITYGTAVNLRGLSPYATLTLIDGHRAPPSGTTGAAVDPSTIPTIMLQEVDIVPDGASATYGSDAIAGVVNLILRRNFEGVEASARGGVGDDYNESQFDLLAGHHWSSGQLTIGFENSYNSALSGNSRSFYSSDLTSRGGSDNRVNTCSLGTINANGVNYAIPAGGVTQATAGSLVAGTQNLCDPLKYEDLIPQQRRYTTALTFDQTITPWLSVYADGYASTRSYERHAPLASGPLTVTNANPYFVAPPGTNATSETVNYWFGGQGLGNTWTDNGHSANYQATIGFKAKLPYDWRWDTSVSYGRDDDQDNEQYIDASAANVAAALTSTNPSTALNLFGSNSTALLKSLDNYVWIAPGKFVQELVDSKFDGPLFPLPGGEVKAAFGVEYESQALTQGLVLGTTQSYAPAFGGLQHLSRDDYSLYGELFVPIIGENNNVPFVKRLDLDAGVRYTDYSDVGSTSNPKVGINWTVNDQLKIHASYGTSFRAPELSEIYSPVTAVFVQTYATPSGPQIGYTLGGGNTGLKPETATTWSIGGDITPKFAPGLKVSLNYFNINYANQISSYLSNLNILENPGEYAKVINYCPSPACTALENKYVYGTGPGATPYPVFGPILSSPYVFVNGQPLNLATTLTDGIDFQVDYRRPTEKYGSFDFGLNGTYFLSYQESVAPGAPVVDALNTIGFPMRLRFRGDVTWTYEAWNAALFVNYENSYQNNLSTPVQTVSAYATVDLHLGYKLGEAFPSAPWLKGTRLGLDITNLFDADPPFVNIIPNANGGGGFDPQAANPIGRIVAFSIDKKF
jgi:iron complex outermembrane receptor protein